MLASASLLIGACLWYWLAIQMPEAKRLAHALDEVAKLREEDSSGDRISLTELNQSLITARDKIRSPLIRNSHDYEELGTSIEWLAQLLALHTDAMKVFGSAELMLHEKRDIIASARDEFLEFPHLTIEGGELRSAWDSINSQIEAKKNSPDKLALYLSNIDDLAAVLLFESDELFSIGSRKHAWQASYDRLRSPSEGSLSAQIDEWLKPGWYVLFVGAVDEVPALGNGKYSYNLDLYLNEGDLLHHVADSGTTTSSRVTMAMTFGIRKGECGDILVIVNPSGSIAAIEQITASWESKLQEGEEKRQQSLKILIDLFAQLALPGL